MGQGINMESIRFKKRAASLRACAALVVLGMANALAVAHAADAPLVDRRAGRPMVIVFDVDPGRYRDMMDALADEDESETRHLRILVEPPDDPAWVSNHWMPTAFVCLMPADGDAKSSYCGNVSLDPNGSYGVARLVSDGEEMFRKTTSKLFPMHAPVDLEIVRDGQKVTVKVGGETIDEGELPFTPASWRFGASTGVVRMEVIEEPDEQLQPGKWAETLDAAVDDAIDQLSENSKTVIRDLQKDEVGQFYMGWGTELRERQGLSRGNEALRNSACGECDAQEATMTIMEGVWRKLQAPPAE